MSMVERAFLINCDENNIVWEDAELVPGGHYFLAFAHLGSQLMRERIPLLVQQTPELVPLLSRKLYRRKDEDDFHITVRPDIWCVGAGNLWERPDRDNKARQTDCSDLKVHLPLRRLREGVSAVVRSSRTFSCRGTFITFILINLINRLIQSLTAAIIVAWTSVVRSSIRNTLRRACLRILTVNSREFTAVSFARTNSAHLTNCKSTAQSTLKKRSNLSSLRMLLMRAFNKSDEVRRKSCRLVIPDIYEQCGQAPWESVESGQKNPAPDLWRDPTNQGVAQGNTIYHLKYL